MQSSAATPITHDLSAIVGYPLGITVNPLQHAAPFSWQTH